jgi:hypothetical protein
MNRLVTMAVHGNATKRLTEINPTTDLVFESEIVFILIT